MTRGNDAVGPRDPLERDDIGSKRAYCAGFGGADCGDCAAAGGQLGRLPELGHGTRGTAALH